MAAVRNALVEFRFDPDVKQALSIIAERDDCSMANMSKRESSGELMSFSFDQVCAWKTQSVANISI